MSRLIPDLLQRRVPQYLAVYLAASWGAVEFLDLLVQRRGLSPQWVDLAIVALLALVPSVILVSYFHGSSGSQRATTIEKIVVPLNLIGVAALLYSQFAGENLGAVRRPDATIVRREQITFTGQAYSPTIAPDGNSVAYLATDTGGTTALVVQGMTDGEVRTLLRATSVRRPRWSPGGRRIAVYLEDDSIGSGIYGVPVDGGPPERIWGGSLFAWSPDGTAIVHAGTNISDSKTFTVVDTAQTQETEIPVAVGEEWLYELAWSPSGSVIAFLTRSVEYDRYTISTITVDGEHQYRLIEDSIRLFSPRWSNDGRSLYYGRAAHIWKIGVSRSTGAPVEAGSGKAIVDQIYTDFSISTDGKRLTYAHGMANSNLWSLNLAGVRGEEVSELTQLTSTTSSKNFPAISRDGQKVTFVDGARGSGIFTVPVLGGPIEQVTDQDVKMTPPAWSPDGNAIAYIADVDGVPKVSVIGTTGGTPHVFMQSTPHPNSQMTWCSETGILYQRPGNKDFHIIDMESGEESRLLGEGSPGWVFSPRCSPDGREVAVMWNRSPRGLWVISLDDMSQAYLRPDTYPIEWSADGEWVLAWDRSTNDIIRLPAGGGEPEALVSLPFEAGRVRSVAVGPDLSAIVLSVSESEVDVWVIENFDPDVR